MVAHTYQNGQPTDNIRIASGHPGCFRGPLWDSLARLRVRSSILQLQGEQDLQEASSMGIGSITRQFHRGQDLQKASHTGDRIQHMLVPRGIGCTRGQLHGGEDLANASSMGDRIYKRLVTRGRGSTRGQLHGGEESRKLNERQAKTLWSAKVFQIWSSGSRARFVKQKLVRDFGTASYICICVCIILYCIYTHKLIYIYI